MHKEKNRVWIQQFCRQFDSRFEFVWDLYNQTLEPFLTAQTVWLDIGCGTNLYTQTFNARVQLVSGVDIFPPSPALPRRYVQADLTDLPFKENTVDLITLRFVAEHLADAPRCLQEMARVLKPGGRLIFLTTNGHSPFIIPARLLPFWLKQKILHHLYGALEDDVLPTYHRLNSYGRINNPGPAWKVERVEFWQDVNLERRWLAVLFFLGHLATRFGVLKRLRTNILAIYQKRADC